MKRLIFLLSILIIGGIFNSKPIFAEDSQDSHFDLTTKQITFGPKHHFFGYIGHAGTIPWNKSGKYILALQTDFQDHMPKPSEAAEIVLLDTQNNYRVNQVANTHAWNFQQGTMMYWNSLEPETQFFFNDRDLKTNEIFCVLFDISKGNEGERIAEYRYKETTIGNSGVAQNGGAFLGINYGRLARLRPVTGYPNAYDWTKSHASNPTDDGVFKVDVKTKEIKLLVSFQQLENILKAKYPDVIHQELFINHTLWSRDDSHILFFARADFDKKGRRVDAFFTMKSDGTELQLFDLQVGGHIEWESGDHIICANGKNQTLVDIKTQKIIDTLGTPKIFPDPKGDLALSPDGNLFVNGYSENGNNIYSVLRRSDQSWVRTEGLDKSAYPSGDLRIDPAPAWNRDSTQFIGYGTDSKDKTRQMFIISIEEAKKK